MYIKCNVVLIPSDENIELGDLVYFPHHNRYAINDNPYVNTFNKDDKGYSQKQLVYITSDSEDINEGDYWIYIDHNNKIDYGDDLHEPVFKSNLPNSWYEKLHDRQNYKKVIATNDTSLNSGMQSGKIYNTQAIGSKFQPNVLPQPSQQFIENYIEELNKGNVITKVDVEYVEKTHNLHSGANAQWKEDVIKVNNDNTINIKISQQENKLYSKDWVNEEKYELLDLFFTEHYQKLSNIGFTSQYIREWVKKNLK